MNLDKYKKIVDIVVPALTLIIIVYFGYVELNNYKKTSKEKNSINLVERYSKDNLLESRMKIDLIWQNTLIKFKELTNKNSSNKTYKKFIVSLVKDNNLHTDITIISEFYEETAICIETGVCDEETITDYFYKKGELFFQIFYPYMCYLRQAWGNSSIWKTAYQQYRPKSVVSDICRD